MKAQRPYPQITITSKGEAALVGGHPWVYEGEVTGLSGPVSDGQLVDVISRRGSWLGCGFFNSRSRIRVRVLSRNPNDRFDRAFWRRRIQYAWDYRKTVMGPEDSRCCRVIFGEADGFPGLTVDRFESVLVAQVLCLGMELIKEELFSLLLEVLRSDGQDVVGVYERNDVAIRELEGMEQGKGWHPVDGEKAPDFTAVDIEENGIRYTVDFENGPLPEPPHRPVRRLLPAGRAGSGGVPPPLARIYGAYGQLPFSQAVLQGQKSSYESAGGLANF